MTNNEVENYRNPEGEGAAPGVTCDLCKKTLPAGEVVEVSGTRVCAECKPRFLGLMREGTTPACERRYAGFWIRFGAKFIDGIILYIANLPVGILVGIVMAFWIEKDNLTGVIILQVINVLCAVILGLCYNVPLLVWKGATVGKLALGLKVVNAEGPVNLSVGKAFGRCFAEYLSGFILYIGYLMVAFDEEKRALHDRICGTRVVYKE